MNKLINKAGDTIPGLVAYVTDEQTVNTIETKMLDGSFTVQTVGDPSTSYVVEFYCSSLTRKALEDMHYRGDYLTIDWRGETIVGYISGSKIDHEKFWPRIPDRQEKLKITVIKTEV